MNLRFKDTIRILKTCDKVDTGIIGCMAFMYKVLILLMKMSCCIISC